MGIIVPGAAKVVNEGDKKTQTHHDENFACCADFLTNYIERSRSTCIVFLQDGEAFKV